MNLQETPPPEASKDSREITFNVFNGATGQQLNKEPLTEQAARAFASKLHEGDAGLPLVIRSNRVVLME